MSKAFTPEFRKKTDAILPNYETKRAALLEVLRMIQEEYGFITLENERETAEYLGIADIDVREVMTFYTLYYEKPRAKTRLNVCRTLSCSMLGADEMIDHLERKLGIKAGQQTADGKFSLITVECLGSCEIAPMMQVNDEEFVGCLTKQKLDEILKKADASK